VTAPPIQTVLTLTSLTTHARDVASGPREAFAAAAAEVAHQPWALAVHTCHRAELYVLPEGAPSAEHEGGLERLPALPDGGRRLEGIDAARHLFATAAGLDSAVVGEDQVLHQLRECLAERHAVGQPGRRLDPVLDRLMQTALHVGREARSRRTGPPRSLGDAAADRLASIIGPLAGRRLLVVGAGQMARLVATSVARHGATVLVANRDADRAASLAHEVGGSVAPFGPAAPLAAADAIILAISAPWPLSPAARHDLAGRDAAVVDLSSPPALDAGLREALGARYTSIDDLAREPDPVARARESARLARLLDVAEASFLDWLRTRHAVPTIEAISTRAEQHRIDELERLFRRADLPDHERKLVEQMSKRLVAGLIHRPLVTLREDEDGELDRAARALFSL
jgi:glutamyl-tRNA reductase